MVDYPAFLSELTADVDASKDRRATLPILAIDECANHPAVRAVQQMALRARVIDRAVDLWYQLRQRSDGSHVQCVGQIQSSALPPAFEVGKPVKGHSWPDEYVVQLLVAQLGASDRVVLVSENTRNDHAGIRSILRTQVAPALLVPRYSNLGLLLFMKKGRTTWEAYAQALLARLHEPGVEAGYAYVEF